MTILQHPQFIHDYIRLKHVTLNPRRHTAGNAYDHCEQVVVRVRDLAKVNACTDADTATLITLAKVHDIGKIGGSSSPRQSLLQMVRYGCQDQVLLNLVKYHDINLPWYIASRKGQPPSPKAWRKLNTAVNAKLLSLFMVADRIDCPGGWQTNDALMWFLTTAQQMQFLTEALNYA